MKRTWARLIDDGCGGLAALPVRAALEVLDGERPVPVPGGARHGSGLLQWQGRWLPAIDLGRLVHGAPAREDLRFTLVVAFQEPGDARARHGAIMLGALPRSVEVSDADACALDAEHPWAPFALAGFRFENQAVPVIDTARLFTPAML